MVHQIDAMLVSPDTMTKGGGHTGEKLYNCPKCDKAFRDSGDLKKRERINAVERLAAQGME